MIDDFNSLTKEPSESCRHYIDRLKVAAEELASSGHPVNNEDVACRLLFGLPDNFRHLRTSLMSTRSNSNKLSTSKVISAILSEERHILNISRHIVPPSAPSSSIRSSTYTASALQPDLDTPGPMRNRRLGSYRRQPYQDARSSEDRNSRYPDSRSSYSDNRPPRSPSCTFCLGYNHVEPDCFLKYPEKHPNDHPINRNRHTSSNRLASTTPNPAPASEDTKPPVPIPDSSSTAESSNHVATSAPDSSHDDQRLHFEYSYCICDGIANQITGNGRHDWMLDSGTSSHFVKWKDLYQSFEIPSSPIQIDTAAGPSSLIGLAIGSMPLNVTIGDVLLRNVIFVPTLHTNCNLLSMTALDFEGFNITFSSQKAFITRRCDNVLWATGSIRPGSNLYFLDTNPPSTCFTTTTDTQVLEVWHKRLAHLNSRGIKRLQSMSKRITIGTPPSLVRNADCVDCLKSSQHKNPSHHPTSRSTRRLQLIHSDTCGPMKVPAINSTEVYFPMFVDDFSRMIWVYGLTKKSDAFPAFQHFVAHSERECDHEKVLILRTDNTGKYISIKWTEWCADRGINLQTTQPYSPDMNGTAERTIRTIVEDASALLCSSHLGILFWYEAVKTAVYLKNRSPHAARDKTPVEIWTGQTPSLAYLRVFGCRCYALIPNEKRSKWESHSSECLFMGYFPTRNLFRLYDISSNVFLKRRDVIFHESIVGHHGFANNRLPIGMDITGSPVVLADTIIDDIIDIIPDNDETLQQINALINISNFPQIAPKTICEALSSNDSQRWRNAMISEIASLERNNTWVVTTLPEGKSALDCKWV